MQNTLQTLTSIFKISNYGNYTNLNINHNTKDYFREKFSLKFLKINIETFLIDGYIKKWWAIKMGFKDELSQLIYALQGTSNFNILDINEDFKYFYSKSRREYLKDIEAQNKWQEEYWAK